MAMAISSRILIGFMNPTIGLIKTVVSELCIEKHQAAAMSVVCASWSIGIVIGPAIGGYTSRPSVQYPGTFIGGIGLFRNFPYLLPNIISALLSLFSLVMIHLYLPETLKKSNTCSRNASYEMVKVDDNDDDGDCSDERTDIMVLIETSQEGETPPQVENVEKDSIISSFMTLLRIESVRISIIAYSVVSCIDMSDDNLIPLWALSEKSKGGTVVML
jgi:MFS family permease